MTKEETKEFVDLAKSNNQKAFLVLYKEYEPVVRRLVRNVFKNNEDEEDISSEIIAKIFRNIHKYSKDISFEMWVKKVTNNVIIDKIRSGALENSNISIDDDETFEVIYTDNSNPEKDLINKQSRSSIEEIIDDMPESSRRIMDLRYGKEYTYQQIADELKVSIGTVKATISRQRKKLINNFKKDEEDVSNMGNASKTSVSP
jgi:RNA polymerase sigma factor (sigma-70 family)